MVKLVDTLVSGTSGLTAVQVRVLFWAQNTNPRSYSTARIFLFFTFINSVNVLYDGNAS